MLSGIWDLEWKCVKNLGQRSQALFIGAQKTANLACNLCTTGWEKNPRAFSKVLEGSVVYNFGIKTLDHFCWNFWRKMLSNRAAWKRFWHSALWSVPRDVGRQIVCRHRRPHRGPGTDAKTPRAPRGERRRIGRCSTDVSPSFPSRHASTVTAPATNPVAAVQVAHVAVSTAHTVTPQSWHARHSPTALRSGIRITLDLLAWVRTMAVGTEPPPPHPELPRWASWPLVSPAAKASRCLTQGPVQPPEPRLAHLDRHLTGAPNRSGQGTAAPWHPLVGGVPTPTWATSRSHVTP
jgi:hypothetical protein